ncbi:hypothetical protein MICRO116_640011 [Micrococcus sp. 116]|nr:hypothetical protein MICRO116_640011 [Micrococcus sp. 116]
MFSSFHRSGDRADGGSEKQRAPADRIPGRPQDGPGLTVHTSDPIRNFGWLSPSLVPLFEKSQ